MPSVEMIFVAPVRGASQQRLAEATLLAERGIAGDRHCRRRPAPGRRHVTLVESELVTGFAAEIGLALPPDWSRRNLVTRDVALNDLVGREFRVGTARLLGLELCEPCGRLADTLAATGIPRRRIVRSLTHRAGLCAAVLEGGRVRVGDALAVPADRR